jgi:hypothetical protein
LKELLNLLQSNQDDFSSISAGLEPLNLKEMVSSAQRFLDQSKTTSAYAANTRE